MKRVDLPGGSSDEGSGNSGDCKCPGTSDELLGKVRETEQCSHILSSLDKTYYSGNCQNVSCLTHLETAGQNQVTA